MDGVMLVMCLTVFGLLFSSCLRGVDGQVGICGPAHVYFHGCDFVPFRYFGKSVQLPDSLTVSATRTLGFFIPSSFRMIVHAIMAEVSIGKMFMAAILPGMHCRFSFSCYRLRPTAEKGQAYHEYLVERLVQVLEQMRGKNEV